MTPCATACFRITCCELWKGEQTRIKIDSYRLMSYLTFTSSGVRQFVKTELPGAVQTPRLVKADKGTFAEFRWPGSDATKQP